ncbi:acyl-CoA thioesterase [Sulfurivirga caldicuralii]|nr:thioesterase family protein [Sulfurivirga caldicuralii]
MFSLQMKVRDYECDVQGVVNNARYLHYFEHARHEWLHEMGIDFASLAKDGLHLMLRRVEVDYRQPLRPGEVFTVHSRLLSGGRAKVIFEQWIERDGSLCVSSRSEAVVVRNGRPQAFGKHPELALLVGVAE